MYSSSFISNGMKRIGNISKRSNVTSMLANVCQTRLRDDSNARWQHINANFSQRKHSITFRCNYSSIVQQRKIINTEDCNQNAWTGPTEILTLTAGFKVQSANSYTKGPMGTHRTINSNPSDFYKSKTFKIFWRHCSTQTGVPCRNTPYLRQPRRGKSLGFLLANYGMCLKFVDSQMKSLGKFSTLLMS